MDKIVEAVKQHKIIAIMRGVAPEYAVPAAQALYDGGIRLIEVTFNQASENAEAELSQAVSALCRSFKDKLLVGAGTVMNTGQVQTAVDAGAEYIISPNTNFDVIKKTVDLGAVSMPGALTPSEVAAAYDAGARFVKVFPAGALGVGYFKALRGPLNHIPLIAVGGVDENNMNDFFGVGAVGVGVGSNIVNNKLIHAQKFDALTALAKKYTQQIDK